MHGRRSGFVTAYLSVEETASNLERHRSEIWERVQVGEIPIVRGPGGQWVVPAAAVVGMNKRPSEND